jgi:hypothetical protein
MGSNILHAIGMLNADQYFRVEMIPKDLITAVIAELLVRMSIGARLVGLQSPSYIHLGGNFAAALANPKSMLSQSVLTLREPPSGCWITTLSATCTPKMNVPNLVVAYCWNPFLDLLNLHIGTVLSRAFWRLPRTGRFWGPTTGIISDRRRL